MVTLKNITLHNGAIRTTNATADQRCPVCGDVDVRVDHAFHPCDEAVYCERCEWEGSVPDLVTIPDRLTFCGLNADWCVSAWFIKPAVVVYDRESVPNMSDGSAYLTDDEDGTFSIVRRYYSDDDNDRIDTVATFERFADAINAAINS